MWSRNPQQLSRTPQATSRRLNLTWPHRVALRCWLGMISPVETWQKLPIVRRREPVGTVTAGKGARWIIVVCWNFSDNGSSVFLAGGVNAPLDVLKYCVHFSTDPRLNCAIFCVIVPFLLPATEVSEPFTFLICYFEKKIRKAKKIWQNPRRLEFLLMNYSHKKKMIFNNLFWSLQKLQ